MALRRPAFDTSRVRQLIGKQAFAALAMSAVVTVFLAWEVAPDHRQSHTVGSRIALWVVFWLAFAALIRVAMFLGKRVRRQKP